MELALDVWLLITLFLLVVTYLKFGYNPVARKEQPVDLGHLVGTFGSFSGDTTNKKPKQNGSQETTKAFNESCCNSDECCKNTPNSSGCCTTTPQPALNMQPLVILYGTQSGTAEDLALSLSKEATQQGYSVELQDMAKYEPDNLSSEPLVVMIISTYTNGAPPPTAASFHAWVMDEGENERNGNMMRTVRYAVFGLGNSLYSKHYNQAARDLDFAMHKMGGQRIFWRGEADESSDIGAAFYKWRNTLWANLLKAESAQVEGLVYNGEDYESSEEEEEEEDAEPLVDLEDLGSVMKKGEAEKPVFGKKMLSESQKSVLSKQGYRIIGMHVCTTPGDQQKIPVD